MSLLRLPTELLLCISEKLEFHQEINAFTRSSRRLYNLLNNGVAFHAENWRESENMRNALETAAFFGHRQVTQLLLDRGADINLTSTYDRWTHQGTYHRYERTALYTASEHGHTHVVKISLDHGANVNVQSELNGSALQVAVEQGHEQIVRLLLDHGADVNARGPHYHFREDRFTDNNALQIASEEGHRGTVMLFLEYGAVPDNQTAPRRSPRVAAKVSGNKENVKLP